MSKLTEVRFPLCVHLIVYDDDIEIGIRTERLLTSNVSIQSIALNGMQHSVNHDRRYFVLYLYSIESSVWNNKY